MTFKLLLLYILLFGVLYSEPITIGGISIGILWKLVAILLITLPLLYESLKRKKMELFAVLYFLFAFKSLFSYSSMDYPLESIIIAIKITMFPLLFLYFIRVEKEKLLFIAKHYAISIILSFVPYIFKLIKPLAEGYPLEMFGLDGQFGLIGPFMFPHAASISLAFAMIVVTLQIKSYNSFFMNLFYVSLIILGFYELILTYVRTGIVLYLVALIYLLLRDLNMKKILIIFMTMMVFLAGSMYLFSHSKIAKMRMQDKNKYVQDDVGSGRFLYWNAAINNWLDDEDIVILIGLGEEYAKDKMVRSVGLRIFAHNEFVQMLQREGLIGFIIFMSSLIALFKYMRRYKSSKYYPNSMAIFIGLIAMMMFQGSFYFTIVFFLAIYLALQKQEILEGDTHDKI